MTNLARWPRSYTVRWAPLANSPTRRFASLAGRKGGWSRCANSKQFWSTFDPASTVWVWVLQIMLRAAAACGWLGSRGDAAWSRVQKMISAGVDPNAQDEDGVKLLTTILVRWAEMWKYGSSEGDSAFRAMVEWLVESGADHSALVSQISPGLAQ